MRMTASWSGPCGRPNTRVWRADPRPMASSPLIVDGFRRAPCPRVSGQGPMTARVTATWMVGRRDQPNRAAVLLGTLQGSQGWKLNLVRQGPKRQQWPGRKPSRPKPLDIRRPIQGRLVLAIPAHQLGWSSPTRPRLGRQRCGPLRPNRGVGQDRGDVTEPERGDVGAQLRIATIAGIHEDDAARQAGFSSRTELIERNLGLGLEGDFLGHARRLAPRRIVSPLLRQVQAVSDRQTGRVIGERERHGHLAVVLLAELAAVLTRYPDRVAALLGEGSWGSRYRR